MNKKILISITDDDQLIVDLLSGFINLQKDMEVLFKTSGKHGLFEQLRLSGSFPDLFLLDMKMKETDGIDVAQALLSEYPEAKIVVLTSHYQPSFTGFMVKLGVSAFLPKGISPDELISIIREVHLKGHYFLTEQINFLRTQISGKSPVPFTESLNSLSPREVEILRLLCLQKTAKEIGEELFIATKTVEGHKNNLFAKTGQKNIAGLVIYAIQRSLISVDELPMV